MTEAELATSTAAVEQRLAATANERRTVLGLIDMPTAEIVDCWWAYDGAELIAEAMNPAPAIPVGLDLSRLQAGELSLHFTFAVSATTTP